MYKASLTVHTTPSIDILSLLIVQVGANICISLQSLTLRSILLSISEEPRVMSTEVYSQLALEYIPHSLYPPSTSNGTILMKYTNCSVLFEPHSYGVILDF